LEAFRSVFVRRAVVCRPVGTRRFRGGGVGGRRVRGRAVVRGRGVRGGGRRLVRAVVRWFPGLRLHFIRGRNGRRVVRLHLDLRDLLLLRRRRGVRRLHDRLPRRGHRVQQLLALALGNVVRLQRGAQVLRQRVELLVADPHATVGGDQVLAAVLVLRRPVSERRDVLD